MTERRGLKALELWCKRVTAGYPGVKIDNMTTSWRDGLAFCAIINYFRPDLIDFDKLNKGDIFRNNELAFRVAQQYLGIPALLDAEDMVEYPVPDRLSIYTYLSQFHNVLTRQSDSSSTRIAPKRTAPPADRNIALPSSSPPPSKMAISSSAAGVPMEIPRREPCTRCQLPVFLVERVVVDTRLYHTSCFRCARCNHQLTAGNYYATEAAGQYCCETCPNEESEQQVVPVVQKSALERSLSDEEKAAAATSVTAKIAFFDRDATLQDAVAARAGGARSNFMQGLLATATDGDDGDETPPALPDSKPPVDVFNDAFHEDDQDDSATDSFKLSVVNNSDKQSDVKVEAPDTLFTKEKDDLNADVSDLMLKRNSASDTSSIIVISDNSVIVLADETVFSISDESRSPKSLLRERILSASVGDADAISESSPDNNKDEMEVKTEVEREVKRCDSTNPFSEDEDEIAVDGLQPKRRVIAAPRWSHILNAPDTPPTPPACAGRSELTNRKVLKAPRWSAILRQPDSSPESRLESTNPFEDDDEKDDVDEHTNNVDKQSKGKSLNPFGDDEDDDEEDAPSKPASNYETPDFAKRSPPRIKLNPFSSDEDDDEDAEAAAGASGRSTSAVVAVDTQSFGSTNSLTSTASSSTTSTYRRKKQAPKPPIPEFNVSGASSPSTSAQQSPKARKSKRAPLPPSSTPKNPSASSSTSLPPAGASPIPVEKEKIAKDEVNRQTQSGQFLLPSRDKSVYGKWKRKKGQAPALPIPQKRTIKALPITELKKELDIIEVQLQGLSKQGVRLEKIIRDQCEGPDADPDAKRIPIEAEDLILQLFEVVNEKNELCRRQAELMYLRRQHRLEEEQADLEYQIRCMMLQSCKTDSDKTRETELIERLVEIVNLRAEIVECLEMDRMRGVEEDDSIAHSLNMYANKRDETPPPPTDSSESSPRKEKDPKRLKKKLLKLKRFVKSSTTTDVDKDIDESELPQHGVKEGGKPKKEKKKK